MGRPALTDDQVADFRARATEVAMGLFVDRGYEQFSLRTLARELGCSHAMPYRYFEGKEEIFAAVRAEGFRRFARALRRGLRGQRDPARRLRQLSHAYVRFAREEPAAFTVIFEMGQPHGERYPFVNEAAADAWGVLKTTVGESVDAGVVVGDVNTLAHTMWAGIHGVATLELARKLVMGRSPEQVLEAMMGAMLRAHQTPVTQGDAQQ